VEHATLVNKRKRLDRLADAAGAGGYGCWED